MKQKIWKMTRPVLRPVGGAIIIALFYLLCIFQEYSKKKLFFLGYSLTNLYFCTRKLEKVW
jgi:hypothetical protein